MSPTRPTGSAPPSRPRAFGEVRILFSNAGVGGGSGSFETYDTEAWRWAYAVNAHAHLYACRAFLGAMKASGEPGHLVITASMVGIVPPPISVAYISSKFATLGIAMGLRNELAGTRVGLSVLCPGMSATNIVETTRVLRPRTGEAAGAAKTAQAMEGVLAGGMDPAKVGERVAARDRSRRFLIFTHPEWKRLAEPQIAEMMAAFGESADPDYTGDDIDALIAANGARALASRWSGDAAHDRSAFRPNAPNGHKLSIMLLEAGAGASHDPLSAAGRRPPTRRSSARSVPNGRAPAIVDHDPIGGGAPYPMFETGAILIYLADKCGRFLPTEPRARYRAIQWLMWQMSGLGPMHGQAHHFVRYAPDPSAYAVGRYMTEARRLMSVMNGRLEQAPYLAGETTRIADIACWSSIRRRARDRHRHRRLSSLARWFACVGEPAPRWFKARRSRRTTTNSRAARARWAWTPGSGPISFPTTPEESR